VGNLQCTIFGHLDVAPTPTVVPAFGRAVMRNWRCGSTGPMPWAGLAPSPNCRGFVQELAIRIGQFASSFKPVFRRVDAAPRRFAMKVYAHAAE